MADVSRWSSWMKMIRSLEIVTELCLWCRSKYIQREAMHLLCLDKLQPPHVQMVCLMCDKGECKHSATNDRRGVWQKICARSTLRAVGERTASVTNGACVIKSALIPYTQHLTLFMLLKSIMHMSGDPMGLNELQNHCPPRGPYHRGRFSSSSKLHPDACK